MGEPSQLYRLIEERLPGTLADLIAARRPHTPWRSISQEIKDTTKISVSPEILRQWFADRIQIEVKVS
jgi:hypothetical protein